MNPIFSKQKIKELLELIKSANNIAIISHQNPDSDSIGSSLAMQHILMKLNKKSIVFVHDNFPSFLNWMPNSNNIFICQYSNETQLKALLESDLYFTMDFNNLDRAGSKISQLIDNSKKIIMIDHHEMPQDYATIQFSDNTATSTCQLVYEMMEAMEYTNLIDKDIASCIYSGILTDTGNFRFQSTNSNTHRIISQLLQTGINHTSIHEQIYDVNTADRLALMGYTFKDKIQILTDLNIAIISLNNDELIQYNYIKGMTEGFVNIALSIKGIKMAVFIKENEENTKLSFRSKDEMYVNDFARKYFNGGGHKNASGGTSIENEIITKQLLIKYLYEEFSAN